MEKDTVNDELVYEEIGRRIQARRQSMGYTQEALGTMIGVSSQHISNIERAHTKLSVPRLAYLARALDVSVDYLLGTEAYGKGAQQNIGEEIERLLQNSLPEERALFLRLCRAVRPRAE